MTRRKGRLDRIGLAPRLFLANGLVILAGAGTLLVTAVLVAPALFDEHLREADQSTVTAAVASHVDAAFDRALVLSLAVGILVSVVAAGAISWLVARRLAAPVEDVVRSARRLADGHYDAPTADPQIGPEFRALARSMNQLSGRLADTEAARRRLTADLAHQLRTPIASLRATLEALADGVLAPDASTLGVLTDQADRLHRLVADLEKVSRAQERQLRLSTTPQSPAGLAARCVAAQRDRYRAKGVTLELAAAERGPAIRVDADRLAEALSNLLDNALRHTPSGGLVRMTVDTGSGAAPAVRMTVQDDGEGFDPGRAEALFDRFHRGPGSAVGTGSGLGLTIARAVVEAHGGTLEGRSDGVGHGATFTIVLPITSG